MTTQTEPFMGSIQTPRHPLGSADDSPRMSPTTVPLPRTTRVLYRRLRGAYAGPGSCTLEGRYRISMTRM